MLCRSFDFICAEDARVLIVGTMPSVKSLERAQYYGHPRNAFWPILFDVFGEDYQDDYALKQALIRAHHLALWDAAACCEREGSLDSDMRGVVYNDFDALYRVCPHIHTVLCNGGIGAYAVSALGVCGQPARRADAEHQPGLYAALCGQARGVENRAARRAI